MKEIIKMINIADIHSVPNDTDAYTFFNDDLYFVLEFLDNNDFDLLTISGDLFETVYKADSPEVRITLRFMHLLLNIARQKNAKVRIIKGTHRHDYDQLSLLEHYVSETHYDFKIYDSPTDEEIFEDFIVKFIPEMYVDDYVDFKDKYLSSYCDVMVFHGMVEGVMKIAERRNDIILDKSVPIMKVPDIENCTEIFAVGGHIHNRIFATDNIWYTNSLHAKSFSDTDDKGFDYITIDNVSKTFETEYIINEESPSYKVIDFTEDFLTQGKKSLRAKLLEMKRKLDYKSHVRLDVDISKLNSTQKENLDFLKVKFGDNFEFKTTKSDLNTSDEVFNKKLEEANMVLDKGIHLEKKVLKVLQQKKEQYNLKESDLDIKKIQDVLEILRTE